MKIDQREGIPGKLILRFQCHSSLGKRQRFFQGRLHLTKPQRVVVGMQMAEHGPGKPIFRVYLVSSLKR